MEPPPSTGALTISLTGRFHRQGTDAAEGVRLWAEDSGVRLTVVDDGGSRDAAVQAYRGWTHGVDMLLGPYSSGLVRAVAPIVCDAGRVLWNHGGSADDLARPGLVSLVAPASAYFQGAVDEAVARQVDRVIVVRGAGPFARAVADGAGRRAAASGLEAVVVDHELADDEQVAESAVLIAGRFEDDISVVRSIQDQERTPALLAAVAAGIEAFGQELGEAARASSGRCSGGRAPARLRSVLREPISRRATGQGPVASRRM